MNNAEEIARYFVEPFKSYMPESELKDEEIEAHIRNLKENIEAHGNATLDELKKLIKNEMYIDDADEETAVWTNHVLEGVFDYIDEAKNE